MRISVLMPTYNAARHLREAIDSILSQTYHDFELLIIDDNSIDGTPSIVKGYDDPRIKFVMGPRQGLSAALNFGIKIAHGEYIARMDADDLAVPERFQKQIDFMDAHTEVGICGTWQQHFGQQEWIHCPPSTAEQTKANLLFFCDLCHSTLMMRKSTLIMNNLFYDSRYASEDYQLWTRAFEVTDIVSLPEVLGKYRHGADNITLEKFEKIDNESGRIVAETLWRTLGIHVKEEDICLLNSWSNMYNDILTLTTKRVRLKRFENLLREIWIRNLEVGYYEPHCLLNAFAAKWGWAKYNFSLWAHYQVHSIDEVFKIRRVPKVSEILQKLVVC